MFALLAQLGITILTEGPDALRKLIEIGEQTKALTPEQAAQYREQLEAQFASAAWRTDAQASADSIEGGTGGE